MGGHRIGRCPSTRTTCRDRSPGGRSRAAPRTRSPGAGLALGGAPRGGRARAPRGAVALRFLEAPGTVRGPGSAARAAVGAGTRTSRCGHEVCPGVTSPPSTDPRVYIVQTAAFRLLSRSPYPVVVTVFMLNRPMASGRSAKPAPVWGCPRNPQCSPPHSATCRSRSPGASACVFASSLEAALSLKGPSFLLGENGVLKPR